MFHANRKEDEQKDKSQNVRFFLLASAIALVLTASGITMPLTASAVTIVNPNGAISCGYTTNTGSHPKYWGIDNENNKNSANWRFGRYEDCTVHYSAWPSGTTTTNYVRLEVSNVGSTTGDFAMMSAAQGNLLSPWNFGTSDYSPLFYPTTACCGAVGYPVSPNHNYKLKVQWVWTNELLPTSTNADDKMYGSMIVHLVMKKIGSSTQFITIDYIVDKLQDHNNVWRQWAYSGDADSVAWGQNSDDSKCVDVGGKKIYTMGIVLDNTSTTAGQWQDKTFTIGGSLTDPTSGAFGSHYRIDATGCSNDPGTIDQYEIKSMALVLEEYGDGSGVSGKIRAGYSYGELFY